MTQKQKDTILPLLRRQEEERSYTRSYLIAYEDFLDVTDGFTDFCCERTGGKAQYFIMIGEIINRDNAAKIFVEVYGFEEERDKGGSSFAWLGSLLLCAYWFGKNGAGGAWWQQERWIYCCLW